MTGNRASRGRPRRHSAWIAGFAAAGVAVAAFAGATAGAASPTAPGAPVIGLATAGVDSVSVAFTAPANDGGSQIFGYKVSCSSSNGGTARGWIGFKSPISVGHLTAAKSYTCTVIAVNRAGASAPSAASNAVVTLTPPVVTAPGAPVIGLATAGVDSVSVAFTAPANDGGSQIFGYKVSCSSSNGGTARGWIGFKSPISVGHLTAAKSYTCTVIAVNRAGASAPSAASNAVVTLTPPVVTAPGAPVIGLATAGAGSVSVAFTAPANDGGSHIFGYKASCSSSNGGSAGAWIGFKSPISVGRLTAAKSYTCTVIAVNRAGASAPSAASNAVVTLS